MSSLSELRKRISEQQAIKARGEVRRDQAQDDLDTARAALKEEFGVETPEQAKERIQALTEARDAAIAAAEGQLKESE